MPNYRALLSVLALLVLFTSSAAAQVVSLGGFGNADRAASRAVLSHQSLQPGQEAVLAVVMDIKDGFHAQSHTPLDKNLIGFEVTLKANPAITVYEPIYPPAVIEEYPALGKVSVYSHKVIVYVPIKVKADAAPGDLKLDAEASYQICDDKSCFPPESKALAVETKLVAGGQKVEPNEPEVFKDFDWTIFARISPVAAKKPTVAFLGYELESAAWIFVLGFFGGILFNVMPCVLPVVPLKAMGFYQVAEKNRAKSFALGAVFSVGVVATFAVLGLFVVVLKTLAWGELFANEWFLGAIVLLLTVFAFSMFGVFTVNLPTNIYRFAPRHDTYLGNFLFGVLTAILSTPCTFGVILGLLVWAAAQPAFVGMALVMMVGFGMAFPYLVLSATPELARKMPRTGPWAELVKQMMGFLLLLSAAYFGRRFIEGFVGADAYWWSLFAIVLGAGIFLIVRTLKFSVRLTPRLVAVVLALIFVLPAGAFVYRITNPPIDWIAYTPEKLNEAKASGKPVMVEFTAAWCGNCLALEGTVFHDDRVVQALKEKNVTPIRVDLTAKDAPGWSLLKQVSTVGAIPLTVIYAPGKDEPSQLAGLYSTQDLLAVLNK